MVSPSFSDQDPAAAIPEQAGGLFINERGEVINSSLELFADKERGADWRAWATSNIPQDVYEQFGILGVEGADNWMNVVEHNVFVAATALTIGESLATEGVPVDLDSLVRAAIIHDASKRMDIENKVTREGEVTDRTFESVVQPFGYTDSEISAAKDTGRLPDRYIEDPIERMRIIANKTIEANIVGYADARTRNVHSLTVEAAMNDSIAAKPKDEEFFTRHWLPYYNAVEGYLTALAPGFDPDAVNDGTIFETIRPQAVSQADQASAEAR